MFYRWDKTNLILNIRVQPRASKLEFAEIMGDEIKLRLTCPPVDGAANQQLTEFLAKTFAVSKAAISIIAGKKGRNKRVQIQRPLRLPAAILPAHHEYNENS